jgi:hypothetical protein
MGTPQPPIAQLFLRQSLVETYVVTKSSYPKVDNIQTNDSYPTNSEETTQMQTSTLTLTQTPTHPIKTLAPPLLTNALPKAPLPI